MANFLSINISGSQLESSRCIALFGGAGHIVFATEFY